MHRNGFTHGNINKYNILLTEDEYGYVRICLSDFRTTVKHEQFSTTEWHWTNVDADAIFKLLDGIVVIGGLEGNWDLMGPMKDLAYELVNFKDPKRMKQSILDGKRT